jgi:hypothetical protein
VGFTRDVHLLDDIVVHDDRIEIRAKSANALALMASSSALDPET